MSEEFVADESKSEEPSEPSGAPAEKAVETAEELRSQLESERAARTKVERDLSSLRGQVRSSHEFEDVIRGEIGGIYKYLDVMSRSAASGDEELDSTLLNLRSERAVVEQSRQLEAEYTRLADELKDATNDEHGKSLFESLETAPELAEARELWLSGKQGARNGRPLSTPERISVLTRAVAEAAKVSRIAERKRIRESTATEKTRREEDRKKKRDEAGELDLDVGAGGGAGPSTEVQTPLDRITRGLESSQASGKRSVIFGG